ncbi:MAG: helix-turn-helix domain-containing protein [Actinomycetes bacterium]
MPEEVKARPYRSPLRAARAQATRRAVLDAAEAHFLADGYLTTTTRQIAATAGVSVDTLYASVGRKPELMLALIESAISGTDRPVDAEDRTYVQAMRAEPSARRKLQIYAAALRRLLPRLAPLVAVLREAAAVDPDCAAVWRAISDRRAANMRLLVADLRATGELRGDIADDEIADFIWSTNAPEYYQLLVDRGWSPEQYERLVADIWIRTLLLP